MKYPFSNQYKHIKNIKIALKRFQRAKKSKKLAITKVRVQKNTTNPLNFQQSKKSLEKFLKKFQQAKNTKFIQLRANFTHSALTLSFAA
jgi:hypothetical protein